MSNLPMRQGDRRPGLYLDDENAKIGGVCAGIARWSGVPAVFWRVALVVAFFGYGTGAMLYLLFWFLMDEPPEPEQKQLAPSDLDEEDREIWDAVKKDMKSLDLSND